MFAVLNFYSEALPIMTTATKREFNTLVTGLSIALGLSVTRGLNEMVSMLRWWVLSRRYYSLRKVDLILQAESVRHVILLACKTRSFRIHASAVFWLLLTLGAQVGLAVMGFCYSVEVADQNALIIESGLVTVPDMSELSLADRQVASRSGLEYLANSYGQMSLSLNTAPADQLPVQGQLRDSDDPVIFCSSDSCRYVFYERAAETSNHNGNNTLRIVVATDRSIESAATCEASAISGFNESNPGHLSLNVSATGTAAPSDVFFPVPDGANQTTYLTNTSVSCGTGCSVVAAVEVLEAATWYYNCTVFVSQVAGAAMAEHEVGEGLRDLAAGGIALQGFQATTRLQQDDLQFQVYPTESIFGQATDGLARAMAMKMARFALGVIAVAAENNKPVDVPGFVPQQGVRLVVEHWNYARAILYTVAGLHLVLGLGVAIVVGRVAIPTGGPVALAQVLRPLSNYMLQYDPGSTDGPVENTRWMYQFRLVPEDGRYDLYIEKETE